MIFYTIKKNEDLPRNVKFPCATLTPDNWDDFGYKTLYRLKIYRKKEDHWDLGDTKILMRGSNFTSLENKFSNLSKDHCSLGQSIEYYEKLKNEIPNYKKILTALNDVAFNEKIYEVFKNEEGFGTSLLRFSEAQVALDKGKKIFSQVYSSPDDEIYNFSFSTYLSSMSAEHKINFNFSRVSKLPKLINVLVGKNGTGKTQFLAKLANVSSGWKPEDGKFNKKPNFSKIIAVSYSPFDEFERPEKGTKDKRTFSYIYCGIRDQEGEVNLNAVKRRWHETLKKVLKSEHKELFFSTLGSLLENEDISDEIEKNPGNIFRALSSGHKIILIIVTDLLATLSEDSLVLFDEPESYLHPNLLSEFMLSLGHILEETKSFSIISTHSPIILQEVPADCVKVIRRSGDFTKIETLKVESFGENISTLTEEVFKVSRAKSNWKKTLKNLHQSGMSYEEIISLFELDLSINAKLYLKSLEAEAE